MDVVEPGVGRERLVAGVKRHARAVAARVQGSRGCVRDC